MYQGYNNVPPAEDFDEVYEEIGKRRFYHIETY